MDRLSYIEDGEERFPSSCVEYVKFESTDLRQFFARFREREDVLLRDLSYDERAIYKLRKYLIDHLGIEAVRLFEAACRLSEVQSVLIWMTNGDNCREYESITASKFGRLKVESKSGKQTYLFDFEGGE